MKLNIRRLEESDYETLVKWWEGWKWPALPKTFLPDTGFIVEKNKIGIVACYVYMTNSKAALLEWVISNPEYKDQDRKEAVELLLQVIEEVCKKQGKNYLFTIGRNKHLIETHKKLGWEVDDKPSHEIVKII